MKLRYFPKLNKIWIQIPKNGSSAINRTIADEQRKGRAIYINLQASDLDKYPTAKRIVMWRDPLDRLVSAYRFFLGSTNTVPCGLPNPRNKTFAQWVLEVCKMRDETRNVHVRTQTELATYGRLPDRIIRWDFDALARELELPTIRQWNQSRDLPAEWDAVSTETTMREYAADFEIWKAVAI